VSVVWKLDRLSRSLSDLLHILKKLDDAEAGFRSLTEAIDTTTPAGRMMMQMLGSFAEFERAMLRERTKLGLARARAAGRKGGARFKLTLAQHPPLPLPREFSSAARRARRACHSRCRAA
jgi:DNA invertase Pin-like site-specific DNA recombinase